MIKNRLEKSKWLWLEELPCILWAYYMTAIRTMGESWFKLAFGRNWWFQSRLGLPTFELTNTNNNMTRIHSAPPIKWTRNKHQETKKKNYKMNTIQSLASNQTKFWGAIISSRWDSVHVTKNFEHYAPSIGTTLEDGEWLSKSQNFDVTPNNHANKLIKP